MKIQIKAATRLKATATEVRANNPKEAGKLVQFLTSKIGNYTSKRTDNGGDPAQEVVWKFGDRSTLRIFTKLDRDLIGISIDKGGYGADFYGTTAQQVITGIRKHLSGAKRNGQVGPTVEAMEAYAKLKSAFGEGAE